MLERVGRIANGLRLEEMVPYIGLSGACFYGIMYWYFVKYGSTFSVLVLVLLLLVGIIGSYVTYTISCYIKESMLQRTGIPRVRIYHSVAFGRYVFALCLPIVAIVSLLHFPFGLYLMGMALVVQRLAEIAVLYATTPATLSQSVTCALVPAIAMDLVFGILVVLL